MTVTSSEELLMMMMFKYSIVERLKLERETENMCVGAKKRRGAKAVIIMEVHLRFCFLVAPQVKKLTAQVDAAEEACRSRPTVFIFNLSVQEHSVLRSLRGPLILSNTNL